LRYHLDIESCDGGAVISTIHVATVYTHKILEVGVVFLKPALV
jgi:hypothetical protein